MKVKGFSVLLNKKQIEPLNDEFKGWKQKGSKYYWIKQQMQPF